MLKIIYFISAFSCTVLGLKFIYNEKYPFAVLMFVASFYYLYKLIIKPKKESREKIEKILNQTDGKEEIRTELNAMLLTLKRNYNVTRSAFFGLAAIAAMVLVINVPFGISIFMFSLIFGFLFYKNSKAVSLLEKEL